MSSANISAQIGKAWGYHHQGRNNDAIREFETILASAPGDVDALYGLGLAQKADGQNEAAIKSFRKALGLAKELVTAAPPVAETRGQVEDTLVARGVNDRYMMLVRMIKQRLAELKAPVSDD